MICAAKMDERLRSQQSCHAWMINMVQEGTQSVNKWMMDKEVQWTLFEVKNIKGGRKPDQKVLQLRDARADRGEVATLPPEKRPRLAAPVPDATGGGVVDEEVRAIAEREMDARREGDDFL